jgi:hypothetical protein
VHPVTGFHVYSVHSMVLFVAMHDTPVTIFLENGLRKQQYWIRDDFIKIEI